MKSLWGEPYVTVYDINLHNVNHAARHYVQTMTVMQRKTKATTTTNDRQLMIAMALC